MIQGPYSIKSQNCVFKNIVTFSKGVTLQAVMKAQRQSRGMFGLGAGWGWVVNAVPQPLYLGERDLVPTVQGGWAPGPMFNCCIPRSK